MFRYIFNSALYYRRVNFVVMLAVAISTAVIGGSLIVGDSVRYSLRQMTLQRLGRVTHAVQAPMFFRQQLASDVQADAEGSVVVPGILLTGSVEANDAQSIRRAGSVTMLGTNAAGWDLLETEDTPVPDERKVVLGYRTANELAVQQGDTVSLWVELPSSIPRDSLLGEREETTLEIQATVSHVLAESAGASRFSLTPSQQLPYNAFMKLSTLQSALGLEAIEASRRSPVAKPARVNAMLAATSSRTDRHSREGGNPDADAPDDDAPDDPLTDALTSSVTLEDIGLRLRPIADRGYVSVESDRMILQDELADAVANAADEIGLSAAATLVYLANEISAADRASADERYSMYSIIAGLPFDQTSPAGPWRLQDGSPVPKLGETDVLLSAWLAEDLKVDVGDKVDARWHDVGSHGDLPEIERTFTVAGIFAADDPNTVDVNLTPHVPGITDVESFADWNQPFDMEMGRITDRDDEYWTQHRATPKAFVSLETAQKLWASRFGRSTSVRVAPDAAASQITAAQLGSITDRLAFEITQQIEPAALGLSFRPVLQEGLAAAVGANDFTGLFIGFSFFLILSAIILASLMFRLGIQQRVAQIGLLNAVGWPAGRVRWFFLAEGLVVAAAGAVVGAVGAVGFAKLMIYGLTTWWVGALGTQFLLLDVQPLKLLIAVTISFCLALFVIWTAVLAYRHVPVRTLLTGIVDPFESRSQRPSFWNCVVSLGGWTAVALAIGLPAAIIGGVIPDGEAFAGLTWKVVCFFVAGFACLTAGLFVMRLRLRRRSATEDVTTTVRGLTGLALANAARSPQRSLLTTALIAFATFVIVAVGAGRRNPLSETPDINSGNGGFSLVGQSSQPILFDLNTEAGRRKLGFATAADQPALPPETTIFSFSMKPGQDASCVNLYQTRVPTLLGASDEFLDRGGFRFADTPGDNPWTKLNEPLPDINGIPAIPVIGDMNTLQFSLKKVIGDVIAIPNEQAPQFLLQVVGMLDGSVLQGVLVLSDRNLRRVDPDVAGSRYFLLEISDAAHVDQAAAALEGNLNSFGMDTERVSERLAGFLAVQNTYLSTFQMLGGLGLLVGTLGLAVVMVRNVIERRREIALLRAVGFTTLRICRVILIENWVLLFWGIVLGSAAALLAMLPHLLSTGADVPWEPLGLTLAAVVVIGTVASVFAVRRAATVSIRDNLAAE